MNDFLPAGKLRIFDPLGSAPSKRKNPLPHFRCNWIPFAPALLPLPLTDPPVRVRPVTKRKEFQTHNDALSQHINFARHFVFFLPKHKHIRRC